MYAELDVRYMDATGDEFDDIASEIRRLEEEIDSVNRALATQSEFSGHRSRLREVKVAISEKRYRVNSLAQALRNIANLYRRTENSIDNNFDNMRMRYTDVRMTSNDLSGTGERTEQVLYGGDR